MENHLRTFTNTGFFNTQSLFGEDDWRLDDFAVLANAVGGRPMNCDVDGDNCLGLEEIFDEISLKLIHDPVEVLQKGFGSGDQTPSLCYYQSIFEMVQQFVILGDIEGWYFYACPVGCSIACCEILGLLLLLGLRVGILN